MYTQYKHNTQNFFNVFLISFIFIMTGLVTAMSMPLFTPIVITFDDSEEVTTTMSTLVESYSDLEIIKFDSVKDIFTINKLMRSYSEIVLVGHGSGEGIKTSKGIVSWEAIASWVNSLPNSKVYFLACNSDSASKLTNKLSVGFSGQIDGVLGALAVGSTIAFSHGLTSLGNAVQTNLFDYFGQLLSGNVQPNYLGYYSQEEKNWNALMTIYLSVTIVLSATSFLISNYLKIAIYAALGLILGVFPLISALISAYNTGFTADIILNFLLGVLSVLLSVVASALALVPWWEIWKVGAVSSEVAAKLVPAFLIVNIAILLVAFINAGWTFYQMNQDINDSDGTSRVKWL